MSTPQKSRPTGARSVAHVGKTVDQRQAYVDQVLKGQGLSSTAPSPVERPGSATDSLSRTDDSVVREEPSRVRSRRKRPSYFARHWEGIAKSIAVTVLATA